jgi:hypothetical protein
MVMFKKTATLLVLMLVMGGTTATMSFDKNIVVTADPFQDNVNATLLSIMSALTNITNKLNVLTLNGTINLANLTSVQLQILYGLVDKNNNYILQSGTLYGVNGTNRGNSTMSDALDKLQLYLSSNATIAGKIDRILHCIAGNNTQTDWSLFQLSNEILFGLIDKDNRYILHNGTLAFPHGNSAMLISLQNDVVISELIKAANDLQNNRTQQIITAGDDNKNTLKTDIASYGKTTVDSVGGLTLWLGAILFILILLSFYVIYLKERLKRYDKRLKYPACYGEPRVFNPEGECQRCKLKEDCERSIIAMSKNLDREEVPVEEAPKKKKKLNLLKRKDKGEDEGEEVNEEMPDCFGKYLAGDKECIRCTKAMECMEETPGAHPQQRQGQEQPQRQTTGTVVSPFDPLAGM